MTGSVFHCAGLFGFALALSGCTGSLSFAMRSSGVEKQADACVPSDRSFEVSTTSWERKGRQAFEDQARAGGVAIQAAGCGWRILPACQVDASYAYRALSISHERSDRGRELNVEFGQDGGPSGARPSGTTKEIVVAGVYELTKAPAPSSFRGDCQGATHVVARYTVGAFRVTQGRGQSASFGVPAGGRLGGSTWDDRALEAGHIHACTQSQPEQPPAGCNSSIDLDVAPLALPANASPAPAPAPTPSPVLAAPLGAGACTGSSDEACAVQCRSGSLAACTTLAVRCAGGSVAACIAASASNFGSFLSANQ